MYFIKMMHFKLLSILLSLSFHLFVKAITFNTIYVKIGSNVGIRVKNNFINLLQRVDSLRVIDITDIDVNSIQLLNHGNISTSSSSGSNIKDSSHHSYTNSLLLLIGNTTETNELIPQTELDTIEHESYIILSTYYYSNDNTTSTVDTNRHASHNSHPTNHKTAHTAAAIPTLACNGLPLDLMRHTNISFDKEAIHYGAVLAGYVCLER